jgi:AraC-like DNA-binding protein
LWLFTQLCAAAALIKSPEGTFHPCVEADQTGGRLRTHDGRQATIRAERADRTGAARGPFILFEPDVLRPDLARLLAPLTAHAAPAVLSPHPDDTAWLQQTALQLLDEHRALGRRPLGLHHALRCSLLESLLLRLANSPGIAPIGTATAGTGRADRYGRFLDALELHFRELHHAADYAELLGCSVRTLSRAAQDATGKGVRELIDKRRLLEARRLLGAARWDARTVAAHLGFTDPANFGRFFRDRTGLTPAAFAAGEATTVTPPLRG